MDICRKIRKARGNCIVEIRESKTDTIEIGTVAKLFGLSSDKDIYKNISRAEAEEVLINVLHKDMAYRSKIMSELQASRYARNFIAHFSESAIFFTNGEYGKLRNNPGLSPTWSSATNATFDTGVIVLSKEVIGCIWFADED